MHRYVVMDSFTSEPLKGNPVAVFFDAEGISVARMQQVAREMNLSEVVFLLTPRNGANARARIFTPVNELPFAGHPLLGAAVALGATSRTDTLRIETAVGIIPFRLLREGGQVVAATMRQPVPTWKPFGRADELLHALGLVQSTLPVEIYHNGPRHVFVALPDVEALEQLAPNHQALAKFPDLATNCFAPAGRGWRSRMFSPAYGVIEDAATGSAAGPLAIHLARHGKVAYGTPVEVLQGVEMGRPSLMRAQTTGVGEDIDSVEVFGYATAFAHGTALI